MFKRKLFPILSLITVLAVSVSLLVGCSGTSTTSTTPVTTSTATTSTPVTTSTTTKITTTTAPSNPEIILSSTTSTRDSGLMDTLQPLFEKETGYTLKPIYNGSGAAMTMGSQGNADVLLVHSPAAEITFMAQGNGSQRLLIMHNDFIIVGPSSDPAGIKGMTSAVEAFKKIAAAKSSFYSRGDNSGTDVMDKNLFKLAGVTVADGSASNPSWYIEGGAGTGMATLLGIASQKGGYTLTDRSTYLNNLNTLSLSIMVEGDSALGNFYHVITVNATKFTKVNAAGATAFANWLVKASTQSIIGQYGVSKYGTPLFFADAGQPEYVLTVTGGGNSKQYTMDNLKALSAVTGWGSTKNKSGVISTPVQYTGVAISTLVKAVGGMTSSDSVKITASDGYTKTLTYDQVLNGTFTVMDSSGNPATPSSTPVAVLVYSAAGNILDGATGPLQLGIMTSSSQASESSFWVKMVVKVEIVAK
jgi:tungstate transport system substrate-binding protein